MNQMAQYGVVILLIMTYLVGGVVITLLIPQNQNEQTTNYFK